MKKRLNLIPAFNVILDKKYSSVLENIEMEKLVKMRIDLDNIESDDEFNVPWFLDQIELKFKELERFREDNIKDLGDEIERSVSHNKMSTYFNPPLPWHKWSLSLPLGLSEIRQLFLIENYYSLRKSSRYIVGINL